MEVNVGDQVKQGQQLGLCGNSGRSPYPHLHFQFQATPFIGSVTIDYPFGNYLLKGADTYSLKTFENPQQGEVIANPMRNEVLQTALHFIPGQRMNVKVTGEYSWVVETDIYNTSYLRCEKENNKAYIYNNGYLHYFTNYIGAKNNAMYWFFVMLYKVPIGFLPNSKSNDSVPLNMMFGGVLKFLQDFVAPVFLFLKVDYNLTIKEAGDILASGDVEMEVLITKRILAHKTEDFTGTLKIGKEGTYKILVESKDAKVKIECQNELG